MSKVLKCHKCDKIVGETKEETASRCVRLLLCVPCRNFITFINNRPPLNDDQIPERLK